MCRTKLSVLIKALCVSSQRLCRMLTSAGTGGILSLACAIALMEVQLGHLSEILLLGGNRTEVVACWLVRAIVELGGSEHSCSCETRVGRSQAGI